MMNLIIALSYALVVSLCDSFYALVIASVMPVIILITRKINLPVLLKLNIFNLIMMVTLALTWPVFLEGLRMGIIITLRLNMIYISFSGLISPMGINGIYQALCKLGIPEKLRVLILLTLRGIYVLREGFDSSLISLNLRAPEIKGMMKFRTIAYVTASGLLRGSERSERIMKAIECRGGFGGFNQSEAQGISISDVIMSACFMVYLVIILVVNYA